jgi:hypothetical protein
LWVKQDTGEGPVHTGGVHGITDQAAKGLQGRIPTSPYPEDDGDEGVGQGHPRDLSRS